MALYDAVMEALESRDISEIETSIAKAKGLLNINHICSNGTTLACAAARTGDLKLFNIILENSSERISHLDVRNKNFPKPQTLNLNVNISSKNNIGYFVLNRDHDENEFGEGPTPEGMEDLQWDTEIDEYDPREISSSPEEDNIYKWYAKILTKTAVYLESPEPSISRLDKRGLNIIHYAVNSNKIEMVDYILKFFKDVNVNQRTSVLTTPLHLATQNRNVEMVKYLLKEGAEVNCLNKDYQTPLHIASRMDASDIVEVLLNHNADTHLLDRRGKSPLILTVINQCEESLKLLLAKGAKVNIEDDYGFTALRRAVWMNNVNITEILIENGARIFESHYLLHLAARSNNLDIMKALGRRGARWDARDNEGNTPLIIACSRKNFEIAEYILSSGASPDTVNSISGTSPLHKCVSDIREPQCINKFIELLIRFGANLNCYNNKCGNALFYAIILQNIPGACALVRHGADVNYKVERAYFDNLSLAKRHGNLELVKMMVFAGFKPSNMISNLVSNHSNAPDPINDFLLEWKSSPLNLREIVRISIRRCLGGQMKDKIYSLPLPHILHRYLALEIL